MSKPLARFGAMGGALARGWALRPGGRPSNDEHQTESGEPAPNIDESIDVSLEYSSVCVVDGAGKIIREQAHVLCITRVGAAHSSGHGQAEG